MSIFSKEALQSQHVLITGATGGIGYETAKVVAAMGANVTITGRRAAKLQVLKEEILEEVYSGEVFVCIADIGESNDRVKLVNEASEALGPITHLVNSAGVIGGATVDKLTQEEMESVMHINYTSVVKLTQLVYAQMLKQEKGAVVNVSSLSGLRGTKGGTAYAASKFALTGFTHSMAVEAIEHNIRVNAVCPGFVNTEIGQQAIQRIAEREGRSLEEQWALAEKSQPSGRITEPKEVAHTIAYLLTDAATNIVGESLKISGGSVLH